MKHNGKILSCKLINFYLKYQLPLLFVSFLKLTNIYNKFIELKIFYLRVRRKSNIYYYINLLSSCWVEYE